MSKRTLLLAGGLALLALPLAGTSLFGDEEEKTAEDRMREMMEIERNIAAPGPEHEALGYFVGRWETEMRMVMPGMTAPPAKGEAEFTWLFEGRWLAHRFRSELMGMPFESYGIEGFDNYKKKYMLSWVDNVSTRMTQAAGVVSDPTGETMTVYGVMDEPSMAIHDKDFKVVRRRQGADAFVQEVWDLGIGPAGTKVVEMTYRRVK